MPTRQSSWERFALWDCFLLLSAIVVGICQARSISMINPAPSETQQSVLLMAMIINAARLGGMYAGPLVLGCHFMFRYRRQCLLPGEWLWLSPLMMAGLCSIISKSVMTLSSSNLFPVSMYYMEIGANVQLSLIALCVLCAMVLRTVRRRTTICWTEYFGCAVCIQNCVFWVYCLIVFPIVI